MVTYKAIYTTQTTVKYVESKGDLWRLRYVILPDIEAARWHKGRAW